MSWGENMSWGEVQDLFGMPNLTTQTELEGQQRAVGRGVRVAGRST